MMMVLYRRSGLNHSSTSRVEMILKIYPKLVTSNFFSGHSHRMEVSIRAVLQVMKGSASSCKYSQTPERTMERKVRWISDVMLARLFGSYVCS